VQFSKKEWSGRWDSNPRLDLGKVPYYPYTTAAQKLRDFNTPANRGQDPRMSNSQKSGELRIPILRFQASYGMQYAKTI
jgi:hypothetical protein